jgi:hypothetical protein
MTRETIYLVQVFKTGKGARLSGIEPSEWASPSSTAPGAGGLASARSLEGDSPPAGSPLGKRNTPMRWLSPSPTLRARHRVGRVPQRVSKMDGAKGEMS